LKTRISHKDEGGKPFDNSFHYHSIIGELNYLEKSTRPDISHAVHQCASFSSCPMDSHAMAIRYIARYLAGTRNKGIRIKPSKKVLNVMWMHLMQETGNSCQPLMIPLQPDPEQAAYFVFSQRSI
jgi:hypothetical protein